MVARNMLPHDIRDVTRPVSRIVGSEQVYELVIVENNDAGGVFDPTITTAVSTTILWQSSDGYITATTGTNHALSYKAPANGPRRWVIRCAAGLNNITDIDCNTDAVTAASFRRLAAAKKITAHTNASLVFSISDLPCGLTYAYFSSDPLLTGSISDLPRGLTYVSFSRDPLLTGALSDLPRGLTIAYFSSVPLLTGALSDLPRDLTIASFSSVPLLTGALSDLPRDLTYASFYNDPLLTAASVAHLTDISDLRIYSIDWLTADVDTVLLSIANAIVANAAHFTYASPTIQIHGTNAAPSGTYQAPTGPGGTPTSGLEAVWIMTHNTGHAWTVTATGGTYP